MTLASTNHQCMMMSTEPTDLGSFLVVVEVEKKGREGKVAIVAKKKKEGKTEKDKAPCVMTKKMAGPTFLVAPRGFEESLYRVFDSEKEQNQGDR